MNDPQTRWNARYEGLTRAQPGVVSPFLAAMASHLPITGSALDIGGGLGANARWLAERGLDVTLLDVSDAGLKLAEELNPISLQITYLQRDVERDGLPRTEQWDLALMHLFYDPDVLQDAARRLKPKGVLLLCQPTAANLSRHNQPSRRYLLKDGEVNDLARSLQDRHRLEIVEATAKWRDSDRHEAWLVARRP